MGQRQDKDEIVYGNRCTRGENLAAPLWLINETPKYIYMRCSLVKKCGTERCEDNPPPPNDRVFKLTQSSSLPCYWDYNNTWYLYWELRAGFPQHVSWDIFYKPGNVHYFLADYETQGDNARFANNECTCAPFNMCGYEGIAVVSWQLESIKILNLLNMKGLSDIFMEMRPLVDGNRIYKFCRLKDATNVAIEYEPD